MIAVYVPAVRTHYSLDEIANAMRTALSAGRSELVRDDVLCLALAKSALETGRWKSCWNSNFGNVKAGPKYVGMYTCITLNEVLDGKLVWFAPEGKLSAGLGSPLAEPARAVPPGHPQTRMRAYANRYDGAYAYVDALITHFPRSYQALFDGDAGKFVAALKSERYFTAAEGPYRKAVASIQLEFMTKLKGLEAPETEFDWESLRERVAAAQFSPLDLARDDFGTERPEEA